jgi:hypothetical protein
MMAVITVTSVMLMITAEVIITVQVSVMHATKRLSKKEESTSCRCTKKGQLLGTAVLYAEPILCFAVLTFKIATSFEHCAS